MFISIQLLHYHHCDYYYNYHFLALQQYIHSTKINTVSRSLVDFPLIKKNLSRTWRRDPNAVVCVLAWSYPRYKGYVFFHWLETLCTD